MTITNKLKANWKSGLTVALVSIPLSISLAVASRVSPLQGIITAIWAGLIASFFGGSNFNIIGPTGALSGIIASTVLMQGIETVSMLAIITGIMILCAYLLRVERYLIFIPSSVIHGFTLGVACIIALNQLNFVFGLQNVPTHPEFVHNVWESLLHINHIAWIPLLVFLFFFMILFLIRRFFPTIPGAVVISALGITLGLAADQLGLETLGSRYGELGATLFQRPIFSFSSQLIWSAFIIALIALLETMLSAKIADGLTKTKHKGSKELLGLGLANVGAGLMGGIPATAALARTVLNIKSGAHDSTSATLSSIFMIGLSLLCLPFFKFMPMAIIAAILINVAINMVETEHFGRLYAHDKVNFAIALVVAIITVTKDPIVGILGGAFLSLLFFVEKISHGYYELMVQNQSAEKSFLYKELKKRIQEKDILLYSFKGKLSYINGQAHVTRFETMDEQHKTIVLNLQELYFIDIDGIDAFDEIIDLLHKKKMKVFIIGVNDTIKGLLQTVSLQFKSLEHSGLVIENITYTA